MDDLSYAAKLGYIIIYRDSPQATKHDKPEVRRDKGWKWHPDVGWPVETRRALSPRAQAYRDITYSPTTS